MRQRPWRGVDFDGTLAYYDGWKGAEHAGEPIQKMVRRVQHWLKQGKVDVKIFTARVYATPLDYARTEEAEVSRKTINRFCEENFGRRLEIVCYKDFACIGIYDDRGHQVFQNTGETANERIGRLQSGIKQALSHKLPVEVVTILQKTLVSI